MKATQYSHMPNKNQLWSHEWTHQRKRVTCIIINCYHWNDIIALYRVTDGFQMIAHSHSHDWMCINCTCFMTNVMIFLLLLKLNMQFKQDWLIISKRFIQQMDQIWHLQTLHDINFRALSIFLTHDVMFHCFHYCTRLYTIMWLTYLSLLHAGYKVRLCQLQLIFWRVKTN